MDNPASNMGLLIKVGDENVNSQNRYCSAQYDASPTLKPKLVIGGSAAVPGDLDDDGDVDPDDVGLFVAAMSGPGVATGDPSADLDFDSDADLADFGILMLNFSP